MKIKTKLTLGVGSLFLLIILLGAVSIYYVTVLGNDTQNILADNYRTLEYVNDMRKALERTSVDRQLFEENLSQQLQNITEVGEKELSATLSEDYRLFLSAPDSAELLSNIRSDLQEIARLNMNAIRRKSDVATQSADTAVLWIGITGSACLLIAFLLLIKLPANIAEPIEALTTSIKRIADRNYEERVNFESHSELGALARSFNTMAAKLGEYNHSNLARLIADKKRIESIINNMHDPVIGLDERMRILFANEEAVKIIGLPVAELVQKDSVEIALKNDLMRLLIKDLVDEHPGAEASIPIKIYRDGKESYFEKESLPITVTPTGEQEASVVGYVIILRDVTTFKELDFAKTNFFSTVSHEFKTPISAIKMSLQLLSQEPGATYTENQKNLLKGIGEDAERLLKITRELLNITQVESGNLQMNMHAADARAMVSYAVNATRALAEQKHIRISIACPDELPQVMADSEKTSWVLTNLLSNAIRYSYSEATVLISLAAHKDSVQIAVADSGQGIAPQYLDKIFERYFRVPGSRKEGTGLGLSISKEFMHAQGGTITVESEFGAGSTFTITLQQCKA